MRPSQVILAAVCVALTLGLFFFGNTKTPKKTPSELIAEAAESGETPAIALVDSLDVFRDRLNPSLKEEMKALEVALDAQSKGSPEYAAAALKLGEFWENQQALPPSSYYFTTYAEAKNDETSWRSASTRNFLAYQMSNDTTWKPYFADKAIVSLEKTLNFAPADLSSKIQLAECLIEAKNEVMVGVGLLKEVIAEEPKNIAANITLGRLSIVSGQFDKAKLRLETVLEVEPENTEALYFLGETMLALGDKKEAVRVFEKCKSLVENPRFKQEIDKYINNVINK